MKVDKRKDYLTWDEYFMGIAIMSKQRSKDPSTQVGACIVSSSNRIQSIGYNGLPNGVDDDAFDWNRDKEFVDSKYPYICHAEVNAISNSRNSNFENSKIYVTLFPCNECAKLIIQSGIKEVVYYEDKYKDLDIYIASKRILDMAGIKYREYNKSYKQVNIEI